MKKSVLFFVFYVMFLGLKAQITFDATYQNASRKLYMVNLEYSGMKYLIKNEDPNNRFISLYNLNHSLWKSININSLPTTTYVSGVQTTITVYPYDLLYVSEKIFDCDSLLEFMYVTLGGPTFKWFTGIYNESLTPLLIADSMAPIVIFNVPLQFKPIYNTPVGTKLILSHSDGTAKVFTLPCAISSTTGLEYNLNLYSTSFDVYPNPSYYSVNVHYELSGSAKSGLIQISDLSGKVIKSYQVDNTFSDLLLSREDIPPGVYIYSLIENGFVKSSKKIVLAE